MTKLLDHIEIVLRNSQTGDLLPVYIDVTDSSLSRKWLAALNELIQKEYHLEKNYCWFGFADGDRSGEYLIDQINSSIQAINRAEIGYQIDNHFTWENSVAGDGRINHEQFNLLHRYFEDLQGVSGAISDYFWRADTVTRWHIRQLNLLCHEFESWILSHQKKQSEPEWMRPSQLMCWLGAPRFALDPEDYELFGIETINRPLGGVYCGINKAIGKSHWEVYWDEGKDGAAIDALTTTTLKNQTEAAGDFDIEWARDPGAYHWQQHRLADFRTWLIASGFDPEDKTLTIGHPKVGQVDLVRTFGTEDYREIWAKLNTHLDVYQIKTSSAQVCYDYSWSDADYMQQQITALNKGY